MLVATSQAAGVYRPDLGWILFGGNDIGTTQKLASVDSKWEKGPAVQAASIRGQCAVQVNEGQSNPILYCLYPKVTISV